MGGCSQSEWYDTKADAEKGVETMFKSCLDAGDEYGLWLDGDIVLLDTETHEGRFFRPDGDNKLVEFPADKAKVAEILPAVVGRWQTPVKHKRFVVMAHLHS